MTSQEKAINLRYLFLTYKPEKKEKNPSIHSPLSSACIGMFQFFSEKYFWPQYMYCKMSPNNGFRWCPLGKLSHMGLEQLTKPSPDPGSQFASRSHISGRVLWIESCFTPVVVHGRVFCLTDMRFSANYKITANVFANSASFRELVKS